MCGLVGITGHLQFKDEKTFRHLLFFDYLRGQDSTGVAAIGNYGQVSIAKYATDPLTCFQIPKFNNVINGVNSKVLMGHNRAATRGATNHFNAHPFEFGDVVGAHNGTLDVKSWDRLQDALGEKFPVDSMALIAAINKLGIKETISLCTTGKDSQTGAWSLVWWDASDGSLNFLRNQHRPMWLAYEKDFKRLFWASEWWMIDAAIRSTGDDYELYSEGEQQYKYFPTEIDQHYKFDIGLMLQSDKKPKPKMAAVKGREPEAATASVFPTKGSGSSEHGNVCGFHATTSSSKKKTSRGTTTPRGATANILHWIGDTKSPLGDYIDERKFNDMARYGCTWCQSDVAYGDPGVTIFERDDMILCAQCSGHNEVDDDTPSRIYASAGNFAQLL